MPKYEVMAGEVDGAVVRNLTGYPQIGDTLMFVRCDGIRVEGQVNGIFTSMDVSWRPTIHVTNWWGVIVCKRSI